MRRMAFSQQETSAGKGQMLSAQEKNLNKSCRTGQAYGDYLTYMIDLSICHTDVLHFLM
jgi:hypothetical protein